MKMFRNFMLMWKLKYWNKTIFPPYRIARYKSDVPFFRIEEKHRNCRESTCTDIWEPVINSYDKYHNKEEAVQHARELRYLMIRNYRRRHYAHRIQVVETIT